MKALIVINHVNWFNWEKPTEVVFKLYFFTIIHSNLLFVYM